MASALSVNPSMSLRLLPSSSSSSCSERVSVAQPRPFNLHVARQSYRPSTLAVFSRRPRNNTPATTSSVKKKKEKKGLVEGDDFDGDPFEVLFSQLEEDLKNDNSDIEDDDDDEIKEEDVDRLATELAEALGDFDFEALTSASNDAEEEGEEDKEDEEEDEEEERPVKLKNWQLRRLAAALKVGRRKTSIKTLAAELCLDRPLVLELLREPPPELLMMSANLPDELVKKEPMLETNHVETVAFETKVDSVKKHEPKVKVPIHVMQQRWSAQKRLKKVQVETLEKVYRRSKRPTNAMISSIVQVTNLPRKRVVKWFEDKRNEDGVPEHHQPYRRSVSETVFSD